jgi:DNA-directed RNA polymerase subunit RPC12/RpoP
VADEEKEPTTCARCGHGVFKRQGYALVEDRVTFNPDGSIEPTDHPTTTYYETFNDVGDVTYVCVRCGASKFEQDDGAFEAAVARILEAFAGWDATKAHEQLARAIGNADGDVNDDLLVHILTHEFGIEGMTVEKLRR